MAVVRATAFNTNKGPDRCWTYVLAWDDQETDLSRLGVDDSVKVVSRCDKPPVAIFSGSGICAECLADGFKGGGR